MTSLNQKKAVVMLLDFRAFIYSANLSTFMVVPISRRAFPSSGLQVTFFISLKLLY